MTPLTVTWTLPLTSATLMVLVPPSVRGRGVTTRTPGTVVELDRSLAKNRTAPVLAWVTLMVTLAAKLVSVEVGSVTV